MNLVLHTLTHRQTFGIFFVSNIENEKHAQGCPLVAGTSCSTSDWPGSPYKPVRHLCTTLTSELIHTTEETRL